MHKRFAWNRKCILLGAKRPGYIVLEFGRTPRVRVGLFDNFQLVRTFVAVDVRLSNKLTHVSMYRFLDGSNRAYDVRI